MFLLIKRMLLNIELKEDQTIDNKEILTACYDSFPEKIKSISVEEDFMAKEGSQGKKEGV